MTRSIAQDDSSPDKHQFPADSQSLRAAVLIAVLIGFALRFYRLDFQELDDLEGVAYSLRHVSFSHLIQLAFDWEEAFLLPASFWLQNVWHTITGSSEFAIRSISAFCSVMAVPLTYRIAADIRIGTVAALAATLLAAANSYAIWHTQRVLYHSLGLALTTASILLALRVIGGVGGRKTLIAYVICTASTFYTHAYAALPLLAQNLYVLFVLVRDRRGGWSASAPGPAGSLLARWTVSQIAVGILCTPWLVKAWPSITDFTTVAPSSPWVYKFLGYTGILAIGPFVPTPAWKLGAGLFAFPLIVAAILGLFLAERGAPDRGKGGNSGWVGPEQGELSEAQRAGPRLLSSGPTVLFLASFLVAELTIWRPWDIFPAFFWSYLALALTPIVLVLAIGLGNTGSYVESRLGRRWKTWTGGRNVSALKAMNRISIGNLTAAMLILVIFAGNLFTFRNFHFESEFSKSRGLRELAQMLESWGTGLTKADVRFTQPLSFDPALWLYYYTGEIEKVSLVPWPINLERALEAVRGIRSSGVQLVILLVQSDLDLEETELDLQLMADRLGWEIDQQRPTRAKITGIARQALSSSYQLAGQETVGPWIVEFYSQPYPQEWRLFEVEFANGLTLERTQISPNSPPAGGMLIVHMEWRGDPTGLTGGEKILLHLLDETGNLVAQLDPEFRPDSSQVLKSVAMPIPPTLPDGPLRLIAGLYDVSIDGAPRIPTEAGEDSLLLVYFQGEACDDCGR